MVILRHASSQELFDYWNTIRAGRAAPERSEVEPSDVRTILGDTFILEVSLQLRSISFRLAGTRLCAAHGKELKGLGFLALWQEEDNFDIARAVNRVYQEFEPMLLCYTAISEDNRTVEYESIMLPLMPAAGGNARILGIATPKTNPYWLGSDPLIQNCLRNARSIAVPDASPSLIPDYSTAPLEPEALPDGQRRVAHLTVFDGGLS
ncbi:MAG: PAS domain-containing protein [Rhizobiaceae bacterium]